MTFKGMAVVTKTLYLSPYHWHVFCTSLTFVISGRLHVASVTQKLFFTSVFASLAPLGKAGALSDHCCFMVTKKKKNANTSGGSEMVMFDAP